MGQAASQEYTLCSVCNDPMIPGQALNGLAKCHWDCKPAAHAPSVREVAATIGLDLTTRAVKPPKPATPKEEARYAWIEAYIQNCTAHSVDILDSDFVCHYADALGVKASVQFVGAPNCPQLGKDLGAMFRLGRLKRHATGIGDGLSCSGFPKWVYTYELP